MVRSRNLFYSKTAVLASPPGNTEVNYAQTSGTIFALWAVYDPREIPSQPCLHYTLRSAQKNDGFVIFPIARRLFFCYNLGGIGRRDAPEQASCIHLR